MQLLSIKVSAKPFQKMIFVLGSGAQKSFFEKRGKNGLHLFQPQEPARGCELLCVLALSAQKSFFDKYPYSIMAGASALKETAPALIKNLIKKAFLFRFSI